MPGPSLATVRVARLPSRALLTRTVVPAGVCTSAFSSRMRPIWRARSVSPSATTPSSRATSSGCETVDAGAELRAQVVDELAEVDRLGRDRQPAGVEPGKVEQVGRQLRQPVDLLPHL